MAAHFELSGEFVALIRTLQGKRRMILRTADGDVQIKIPRALRRQIDGRIAAGSAITISGLEFPGDGARREVLRVQVRDAACFTCPIQVCTKKNCWKQGGRELWNALESTLANVPGAPVLEGVDCLDRCKRAPNFDCGDLEFERCPPDRARRFVHDLAAPRDP